MPFTEQQASVVYFKGHELAVKSGAGTGKTTILRGYAEANPTVRMLYLCYNKAIQEEAKSKFPKNVICRTMHSIAYAMVGKAYQSAGKLVGNLRLTDIKNFLETQNWELVRDVNRAFNNFLSSASQSISEEHAFFVDAHTERQRARKQAVLSGARKMWEATTDLSNDFPTTHDVYLKLYCLKEPEMQRWFGAILFDEAQDANPVVSDFVYRQRCKHIVVGDDHQQLYRWRGANNSIDAFVKEKKAEVKIINKSFRFGPNIAKLATAILQYKSDATHCPPFPVEGNEAINDRIYDALPSSELNKPYTRLHRTVSGTISTALSNIEKRLHWVGGIENYNVQEVLDVYHFSIDEKDKIKRKKLKAEFKTYDAYKAAADATGDVEMNRIVKMIDEHGASLPSKIHRLRRNEEKDEVKAEITISTAHRSKGLEWDTVVLDEDFRDVLDPDMDNPEEIADELNLLYVASTRAMKVLQPNALALNILGLVKNKLKSAPTVHRGETKASASPYKMERPDNNEPAEKQRVRIGE